MESLDIYDAGNKVNLTIRGDNYSIFKINDNDIGDLPDSYDMRDTSYLSEVKNQEAEGNCWAFAAMASLESCILKANNTLFNFSEQNMKNLMVLFSDVGMMILPNTGGNPLMSAGYFASWLGPIYEEYDLYSTDVLSKIFPAIMHVQNIIFIQRTAYTENNAIKEAILKYGAVATTMYYNDTYLKDNVSYYYDGDNSIDSNHAITIVGWNDTYSKNNFAKTPASDGAFIVKNSWGPDWGENGYFYV